jgi:hypothetical protein
VGLGGACGAFQEGKEALLFEKRSKNFCQFGWVAVSAFGLNIQKFFGSFFQKRTFFLEASLCCSDKTKPALPR